MMRNFRTSFHAITLLLVVMLGHQFLPVCLLAGLIGPRACELSLAPVQVAVSGVLAITLAVLLIREGELGRYTRTLRRNWLVILFVIWAIVTNLWSVNAYISGLRSAQLLLLAFIASYFGLRFQPKGLLEFVATTLAGLGMLSLLLGIFLPSLAIMANSPYEGLWRGVYWHKVYLGASMGIGYIAFAVIVFSSRKTFPQPARFLSGAMLVISLVLAFLSDSASGLLVIVLQTGLLAVILIWLRWGHLLTAKAYLGLFALLVAGLVMALANLDSIFALFNRSASMTGRIPLWAHLLGEYITRQPMTGHGIGAFWYQPGVSRQIQAVVGWGYPVGVSDNGYMDILLGMGIPGLAMFAGLLVIAVQRSLMYGLRARSLVGFFPLLLSAHILLINFSLSYFMESESFVWFLLALVLFMPAPSTPRTREQGD